MRQAEEWRPVVGFEESHEVSSLGRMRSLDREVWCAPTPGRPDGGWRKIRGQAMKTNPRKSSPYVFICMGRPQKLKALHHMILEAFVGPRPEGQWGRHLNDIKTDNRVVNLAWGTPLENYEDAIRNGTRLRSHEGMGAHFRNKTHCPQGHEYTTENTLIQKLKSGGTGRTCRICKKARETGDPNWRELVRVDAR